MSLTPEALSTGQQRSLEELKGRRKQRLGIVLSLIAVSIICCFAYASVTATQRIPKYLELRQALSSSSDALQTLVITVDRSHDWLRRHGTSFEFHTFNALTTTAYSILVSFAGTDASSHGALAASSIAISGSLLRIAFLFLACMRIWLIAIVFGIVRKIWYFKPHHANEFLGLTGNGRFYYSGIRVGLDTLADDGAPDLHVRGLICLPVVEGSALDSSKVTALLKKYNAYNETNKELLAIVLAHKHYPAYLDIESGQSEIQTRYLDEGLDVQTTHLLQELLTVFDTVGSVERTADTDELPTGTAGLPALSESNGKIPAHVYAQQVARLAVRVLTPALRKALSDISATHVATVILSLQAAKCLGYEKAGAAWIQKTSFLQLSGRAVLHSTEHYGTEYSYQERGLIRQALIYASRRSVFGPVALPVDISRPVQALRSWSELLLANPVTLQAVADRVELYCLCWELEKRFRQAFVAGLQEGKQELVEGIYYSQQDMIFVPLKNLLRILLQVVPKEAIDRLSSLTAAVSDREQGGRIYAPEDQETDLQIPPYMKVLAPLTSSEKQEIITDHACSEKDINRWDALRMILFSYSWLGRQIGHVAVPDSSIVFAILKNPDAAQGVNKLGLVGERGVVPIRASRVRETIGSTWKRHCIGVHSVAIADQVADFEALLNGKDVKGSEDLGSTKTLAV